MRTLSAAAALGLLIAAGALAPAAQNPPKKSKPAKAANMTVRSRPVSKPPVIGPNRGRRRTPTTKSTKVQAKPVRRAGQQAPSVERYREIQQSLADRGYLKSEPTGRWDDESVQALRRFEQDQNLRPDGKLDSLALIALGLGPKPTTLTDPSLVPAPQQ